MRLFLGEESWVTTIDVTEQVYPVKAKGDLTHPQSDG